MTRSRRLFGRALLVSLGLAFAMLQPASARIPNLNVKIGLWEVTSVTQTSGAPPVDMNSLSPEQRARMQAMMDKMMKSAAVPHTFRSCLTQEKLSKNPFQDRTNDSCKQTVVSSSTSAYDVKLQCTDERGGTTSGEWRFEAATPELVKGNGHMTIERAGRKMESTSSLTAKWVGASCGEVK